MTDIINNKRLSLILSILSFLIIVGVLSLIIFTPIADGYEISIYDAFPWYFWFLIILSAIIGQVVILIDFFKGKNFKSKQYLLGLLVLIIISLIILSMPYIRGYVTHGRTDHLSHVGEIKDIINYGKISENNFYPNEHIFTSIIAEITDIEIINLSTFIPRIFPFIFLIGFIILSRFFLKNYDLKIILLFPLSFFFFSTLGVFFAQCKQSFLILPIILFVFFKRSYPNKNISFNILFFVLLIGYIAYHPLNNLFLMFFFAIFAFTTFVFNRKHNKTHNLNSLNNSIPKLNTILIPFLTSFLLFTGWYLSFLPIKMSVRNAFYSIFYGFGIKESVFSFQYSVLQDYSVSFQELIKIGVFEYGILIIFALLTLWAIFYLIISLNVKKYLNLPKFKIMFLSLCIIFYFGLTSLSFFFSNLFGWPRYFRWSLLFSFLLLPIAIEIWLKKKNKRSSLLFKKLFIIFIISLTIFISLFSFYNSPLVMHVNQQVTQNECQGFKFLMSYRNDNYLIDEVGISQFRFFDAFHKPDTSSINIRKFDTIPPNHFGYNSTHKLGEFYSENRYLIITKLGIIHYPMKYPNNMEVWRFSFKDFDLLVNDNTVNRIYTTDFGFDTFVIK